MRGQEPRQLVWVNRGQTGCTGVHRVILKYSSWPGLGVAWVALTVLSQGPFSAPVFHVAYELLQYLKTRNPLRAQQRTPACASLGLAGTLCLPGCSLCWGPGLQPEDSISPGQHPPLHRAHAQFCHLVSPAIKQSQLMRSQNQPGVPQGRQRYGVVQKLHVSSASDL